MQFSVSYVGNLWGVAPSIIQLSNFQYVYLWRESKYVFPYIGIRASRLRQISHRERGQSGVQFIVLL